MHSGKFRFIAGFFLPALLASSSLMAQGNAMDPSPREYFVRQEPEEPLVIRVVPYEAEFSVRVTGPEGELLRESELPGNRTQPLYLYIPGADKERQLDIAVSASSQTNRTRFEVEFYRLDVRDDLSQRLARAYQLISQGQERQTMDSAANWSVRVNMLLQAERLFADFGMEEHRLWAALSAAHLAHRELGETETALDWVGRILAAARLSVLQAQEFSATVLRGELLFSRARSPGAAQESGDVAQASLSRTEMIAEALGNGLEQALAQFMSGEEYVARNAPAMALERYRQALDIALERNAADLAAEVRKQMVSVHERMGDVVASEQVLDSMVEQLASEGAQDELVRGLLAQGQLYLDLFRFPDAIEALERSLAVDNVSLTRTQATIMLGTAFYESGRFGLAAEMLEQALTNPGTGLFRRPNPLLALNDGLRTLANVYRIEGRIEEARRVRNVQSRHLEGTADAAEWALQHVLDEISGGSEVDARQALESGMPRFRAHARGDHESLAVLALCAAFGTGRPPCSVSAVDSARDRLRRLAGPRRALQAEVLRGRFMSRAGQDHVAGATCQSTLPMVHFYRAEFTGVLGAWYWEERESWFAHCLDVLSGRSPSAAEASFHALTRILAIGRVEPRYAGDDALRARLNGDGNDWRDELGKRQADFMRRSARFDDAAVKDWLGRLDDDEAVLAILPEGTRIRTWLATRAGVQYLQFPAQRGFQATLDELRHNETAGLQGQIGDALLGGIVNRLPERIYWLPVGNMLGIDLGALRPGGVALSEQHAVVGLVDFPAPNRVRTAFPEEWPQGIFLAGDPSDWTSAVPERLIVSPELAAVRDRFVGGNLHMVQGNALLPDEFVDRRLSGASLVHLALPVRVDLADPDGSALELSEPGRGQGRFRLFAPGIRSWGVEADLWVLGQSTFVNQPVGPYQSRLGIIGDLAAAGAGLIMNCRPNQADATAIFFATFYRALGESGRVIDSMRQAARSDGMGPACELFAP